MTIGTLEAVERARAQARQEHVQRFVAPLLAFGTAAWWWRVALLMRQRHPEAMALADEPALAAAMLLGGQLLGNALEALSYAALWAAQGVRVRLWPLASGIFAASAFEAAAWQIALSTAPSHPWSAFAAWLAGVRVLWDDAAGHGGFAIAFGGVGMLTFVRLAATAEAQQRAGARRVSALVATCVLWLAFRLIAAFTLDLLRGASPV